MAGYTLFDFTESCDRASIDPKAVESVEWAWGADDGSGSCSDSFFGFVLAMKDGRSLYLTGWCDTTGWGCQDGGSVIDWERGKKPEQRSEDYYWSEPDEKPADLNKWIADGCPENARW